MKATSNAVRRDAWPVECSGTSATGCTHRFEETINGHGYTIEVRAVQQRWRADLLRSTAGPAALMPFYGSTPQEAARQLASWLARAHGVARNGNGHRGTNGNGHA